MTDLDLMSEAQVWFMAGASATAWLWLAASVTRAYRPRRSEWHTEAPRSMRVNIERGLKR